jgi:hypothetical protein
VGVDARRHWPKAVRIEVDRLNYIRDRAVTRRRLVAVERSRSDVFLLRPGVGGRLCRVVHIGTAEVLEARRQPVLDINRVRGINGVVANSQRVDGLMVVGAAEKLAFRTGFVLDDLDR